MKVLQQKIDYLINIVTGEEDTETKVVLPANNLSEFLEIDEYIQIKQQFNTFVNNNKKELRIINNILIIFNFRLIIWLLSVVRPLKQQREKFGINCVRQNWQAESVGPVLMVNFV